ncbi:MAG TPA: hypothetical protein VGM30_03325 [Puia sp.]|jgi:hypothetical protein
MASGKEIAVLLAVACMGIVRQDVKVVTYSTGKADTEAYESLSFWIKDNQRAYIRYSHGKEVEDEELSWLGRDSLRGETGFKVRFPVPDTLSLYVIQKGYELKVTDRSGRYLHAFVWENENKPGQEGCSICAQTEKEAMGMLQKYFFK